MIHNDVLRSVRYMLDISDNKMVELIKLGGMDVTKEDLLTYLKKDEEEGFVFCPDEVMAHFLDGLVIFKRGKDDSRPPQTDRNPGDQQHHPQEAARGLRTEGRRHARHPQGGRVPGVQA
jgi:uncharacterized protein YehS (DUF1456 family)